MNRTRQKTNYLARGFTLIELLIVIVIIAILAGVVIGVLNPIQQQNRARDAGLRGSINKAALSAKSLMASSPRASNQAPTVREYYNGLANTTEGNTDDCSDTAVNTDADSTTAEASCSYLIEGIATPDICAAGTYVDDGAAGTSEECEIFYVRSDATNYDADDFRIVALSNATPNRLFVFEYNQSLDANGVLAANEGFFECAPTGAVDFTTVAPDGLVGAGCTRLDQ